MTAAGVPPLRFAFTRGRSEIYGIVYRPSAKVYLRSSRGTWLPHYMLVDTGADFSLLPKLIGEVLGLTKSATDRPHRAGAVGGWIWVIMRRLRMRLGDREFEADVGWAQTNGAPLLLGRADVFDHFRICFDQREHATEFDWRG